MINNLIKLPIIKRLYPSLLRRYLSFRKTYKGFYKIGDLNLYLNFLDSVDREVILNNSYDKKQLEILINEIKKNKILYFLDIGANSGYYSFFLGNLFKKINIFSFQTTPSAYDKIMISLNHNKKISKKIKLYKFGLSDKNLKLLMQSQFKHGLVQTGGSSVVQLFKKNNPNIKCFYAKFKKGDDVLKVKNKKICIKIDVEGHEIMTLSGIKKLLKNNKIFLQIEIFDKFFDKVNFFLIKHNFNLKNKVESKDRDRADYFYQNF